MKAADSWALISAAKDTEDGQDHDFFAWRPRQQWQLDGTTEGDWTRHGEEDEPC